MPKLAYFPWYPAEAAGDGWWRSLTIAEKGLHHELLDIAWPAGGLEKDLNIVARSVGLSRKEFDKLWPRVSMKWLWNGEFLVNNRQERERAKVQKISKGATDAANRKWELERQKKLDALADANALNPHSNGTARAYDSDSDSDSDSLKKEKKDSEVLSPDTDESWQMVLALALETQLVMSEDPADLRELWRLWWCPLSFEQRKDAIEKLRHRQTRQYADPSKCPTFENFLRYKRKENNRPESNGKSAFFNGKPPMSETDRKRKELLDYLDRKQEKPA